MKCVRCRSKESEVLPLCKICSTINPKLSELENKLRIYYYFHNPEHKEFFNRNRMFTEEMVEAHIESALEGSSKIFTHYNEFYNLTINLDDQEKTDFINDLINDNSEISLCKICNIPISQLCNHLTELEKMIILFERENFDEYNRLLENYENSLSRQILTVRIYIAHRDISKAVPLLDQIEDQIWNQPILKLILLSLRNILKYKGNFADISWIFDRIHQYREEMLDEYVYILHSIGRELLYEVLRIKVFELIRSRTRPSHSQIIDFTNFISKVINKINLKPLDIAKICLSIAKILHFVKDKRYEDLVDKAIIIFNHENYPRGSKSSVLLKAEFALEEINPTKAVDIAQSLMYEGEMDEIDKAALGTLLARAYAMQDRKEAALYEIQQILSTWNELPDSLIKAQVFLPIMYFLREQGFNQELDRLMTRFEPLANKYGQFGDFASHIKYHSDLF